jgi:hypothetical protein
VARRECALDSGQFQAAVLTGCCRTVETGVRILQFVRRERGGLARERQLLHPLRVRSFDRHATEWCDEFAPFQPETAVCAVFGSAGPPVPLSVRHGRGSEA